MTIHISMKSGLFLAIILVALTGFDKGFEIIKERGATYQQVTRPQITDWVEVSPDGQKSPLDIHYPGAQSIWLYRHKYNQAVYALLIIYTHEQQGAELINSANRIFETRVGKPELLGEVALSDHRHQEIGFKVSKIALSDQVITVFSHFQIFNRVTTSAMQAKLFSIGKLFFPASNSRELVFLLHDLSAEDERVQSILEDFYAQLSGYDLKK